MAQHLQAIYDTRVAEGVLRPDPAQRAALLRLESVRETSEQPARKGLLSRFRRAAPQADQEPRCERRAVSFAEPL